MMLVKKVKIKETFEKKFYISVVYKEKNINSYKIRKIKNIVHLFSSNHVLNTNFICILFNVYTIHIQTQ